MNKFNLGLIVFGAFILGCISGLSVPQKRLITQDVHVAREAIDITIESFELLIMHYEALQGFYFDLDKVINDSSINQVDKIKIDAVLLKLQFEQKELLERQVSLERNVKSFNENFS